MMIRTALTKTLFYLWLTLCAPILGLGVLARPIARFALKLSSGGGIVIARWVGGIKYEIHGKIPTHGIVASKHMSLLEVAILFHKIPNSFFVLKRELMWIPLYGWSFWRGGMIPVNRARANVEKMTHAATNEMKRGRVLIIFPEGTRTAPGAASKFKRGVLNIAEFSREQITPVGVNTGLYWPKRGHIKPGTAQIYFEKPLPFDTDMETLESAIQSHSA